MFRSILIYGLISGGVVITGTIGAIVTNVSSVWLGYLIMLVALSSILVAVKQHRDQALGGVIRFVPAFLMSLGIAVVAGLVYVGVWEGYLAATGYRFMDEYTAHMLAQQKAAGLSHEAYAKLAAEMETMRVQYANPLFRMPMTFAEIFPVGLLVALVSAVLLRNPKFLPARTRAA